MNPNELRTRFRNLVGTKPREWYRIVNQAAGATQIHIYNDIGISGVTARDLVDDLARINGPVEVRLNSEGGEIFDGIAIYNALCTRDVAVYIDSLAASAASFIAMAASPGKLFMAKNASMMIHEGQAMAMGNARELGSMVDILNRESEKIASIYGERAGKPTAYFRDKMQAETWYNAAEALAEGLIDVVFDPRTGEADAATPVRMHTGAAGSGERTGVLVNSVRAASDAPAAPQGDEQLGDGWVKGADGKTRFDPDGDGDDDSTPEGDTDHDYFDESGKQIKEIPPCPGMGSSNAADTVILASATDTPTGHAHTEIVNAEGIDNSPWDAAKAWHGGVAAEDPEAFYSGICAGKKTGDPDTQDAWALPYRYTPSSPPNAAGVRAALARLSQTQGLINKAEAQATLEGLMKKINPDYEKSGNHMDSGLLSAVLTQGLKGAAK